MVSAGKPTAFVVFTSPRTGSSWLIDLLDSHPRIEAYAELFLPGDRTTPDYGCGDRPRFAATLRPRRRISAVPERLAYLRRLYAPRNGIDAVGFKLMYGHPTVHAGLLPYLAARRARAVHLIRENAFEQIVSWETSIARGRFRAHHAEAVVDVTVALDTAVLVERLAERERSVRDARRTLRRRRFTSLEVRYEQLRDGPRAEVDRVAGWLGVAPHEWASSIVRMNVRPWREAVSNADEVERALAGTAYAWMLR